MDPLFVEIILDLHWFRSVLGLGVGSVLGLELGSVLGVWVCYLASSPNMVKDGYLKTPPRLNAGVDEDAVSFIKFSKLSSTRPPSFIKIGPRLPLPVNANTSKKL